MLPEPPSVGGGDWIASAVRAIRIAAPRSAGDADRMLPNALQPTSRADRTPRQRRRVPGEHVAGTALCVRARCAPSRFRRSAVGRPPARAAQRFEPAAHRRRRSQRPGNDVGRSGGDRRSPHTDIGIPRLGQAVDLLASHAAATAFVELKRASLRAFGPRGCRAQGVRSAQAGSAPVRAGLVGLRSRASRATGVAVSHRVATVRLHEHRRAEMRGARAGLPVLRSPAADAERARSSGAARGAGSSTTCRRRSWRSSSRRAARGWSRRARSAT